MWTIIKHACTIFLLLIFLPLGSTCGTISRNPSDIRDWKLFNLSPSQTTTVCTTPQTSATGNYSSNQLTQSAAYISNPTSQGSGYRVALSLNLFILNPNHAFFSIWTTSSATSTVLNDMNTTFWEKCSFPNNTVSTFTSVSSLKTGNRDGFPPRVFFGHYKSVLGTCFFSDGNKSTQPGVEWDFSADPCPAGYYCLDGASDKTPCPSGTFNVQLGSFSSADCDICPKGKYSSLGSSSCTPCEPGRYSLNDNAPNCTLCPVNTFNILSESSKFGDCKLCPRGEYSDLGSAECSQCDAGSYLDSPSKTCKFCSPGFYSDTKGLTLCTPCSPGTYSTTVGADSNKFCVPCSGGFYGALPGLFSPTCSGPCNASYYGDNLTNRTTPKCDGPCKPGQTSVQGSKACTNCPPNTFNLLEGSVCLDCPSGKGSLAGSVSCSSSSLCFAGTYYFNSSTCLRCPSGSVSVDGAYNCLSSCPVNTYYSPPKCLQCPPGKTSLGGNITSCTNAPCNGLCLYNSSMLDNRRVALPCSAALGSRVFIFKDPITPPFYFNLESFSTPIITKISVESSSMAVYVGWNSSTLTNSVFSPSFPPPINVSVATKLLSTLLMCVSNLQPLPLSIVLSVALTLAPLDGSSSITTKKTLIPLVLMDSIPTFPGPSNFLGNLTISKSTPLSPQLSFPSATSQVCLQGTPIKPWLASNYSTTLSWSSDSPASLSRVVITIDRGCVPGDSLKITAPFFGQVTNFSQPRCSKSSFSGIELEGSGSLYEFLTVLDSLQFIPSTTPLLSSANLPRIIKYQFDNVPTNLTLFTTITVTPGNSTSTASPIILSSSTSLPILEGAPPDFAIAVMPFCPNPSQSATFIHGVPTLCFNDLDTPAFRLSDAVDAYSGPLGGPLLMRLATNFSVAITPQTASPPFSACISASDWSAEPVGASVSDCSSTNPDSVGGVTQPLLCFWQRYRIVLSKGRASYSSNVTCGADCLLDYESSCSTPAPTSAPLSFPAIATITSFQVPSVFGSPGSNSTTASFTLNVTNVKEPPQLAWPDFQSLSTLGYSTLDPLPASSPLIIDDTTGQPNSTTPYFLYCSQDNSTIFPSFSLPPLEGTSTSILPSGSFGLNAFLNYSVVSSPLPPSKFWLKDVPACFAALSFTNSTGSSVEPYSWAYVTPLSIVGIGRTLRQIPARSLTVYVQPYPGSPKSSAFLVPILLTRNNQPVSWITSSLSILNLAENTLPLGNTTANLTVADADFEQDVTFKILNVSLAHCKSPAFKPGPAFQVPEGLFVTIPYPKAVNVTDYATNTSSTVFQTRSMSVGVGVDALDIDSAAFACGVKLLDTDSCLFDVTIQATDTGNFTPSHSLLPLQPPTSAIETFRISVKKDIPNAIPKLTGIVGIPPLGLSTGGGDTLVFIGTGLGLPAGPTSNVSIVFHNGASFSFPLLNCTVITRLSRVRCVTSPGFDNVTHISMRVGTSIYSTVPVQLPYFQRPRVVAVLDYNGTASWHGVLPTSSSTTFLPASPGPANITVLVDATSYLIPLTLGVYVNVWAGLLMDFDKVLPLGSCSLSTHPAIISGSTFWGGLGGRGQRFNLPSLQQSASWFDCPLSTSLSTASFREVLVKVDYSRSTPTFFSPYTGPLSTLTSEGTQWWVKQSGITKPNATLARRAPPTITSVTQATLGNTFIITGTNLGASNLSWWSDIVDYAALDASGAPRPCFVSQQQTPPHSSTSNSTDITFSLASPSCAIHRGVGCKYIVPHTQLACEMEWGGWGGGFSVRVIVGGQSSPWFSTLSTFSSISYAPPILTGYTVASVMGMNKTTSNVMEPSGGGLLVIQGRNLWPPEALVITVGGVRVYPLNARPLNSQSPTLPFACTSNATFSSALLAVFNSTASSTSTCFGDAPQLWSTSLPEATQTLGKALVVVYPPGLGVVAVEVALGATRTSINATYAPPSLLGVATAAPYQGINGSYTLFLNAASLSPCAFCRVNGSSTYPPGFIPPPCAFIMDSPTSSANISTLVPGALPGALEGSLPYPFAATNFSEADGNNVALENCALPSNLWEWNSSDSNLPSYRSRIVTQFPFPSFQQDTASLSMFAVNMKTFSGGDLLVVEPVSLIASQATLALKYLAFSPTSNSSLPIATTNAFDGSGIIRAGTNGTSANGNITSNRTSSSGTLDITPADLKVLNVTITSIPLSIEFTDIAQARLKRYTLKVDNTGPYGALFVTPTYQEGKSAWLGGPIVCPMTPFTTLSLTNLEGKVIAPLITDFFAASPFNVKTTANFSDPAVFLDITGDQKSPSWRTSAFPTLPCRIISWQGSASITSLALTGQTLVVTMPAWIGLVNVQVFSKDSFSKEVPVAYATPSIRLSNTAMQPSFGPANGGTSVVISGTHFGDAGSLGELWYKTGAAGVYAAINASGSLLPQKRTNGPLDAPLLANQFTKLWPQVYGPEDFPHALFFSYDTSQPTDETKALRRYCVGSLSAPNTRILNWTDTTIQCLTPEGVAGSSNIPYISMNYAPTVTPSSTTLVSGPYAKFKYDSPFLTGVWVDWFSTPPLVHLGGVGLSRFDGEESSNTTMSTPGNSASPAGNFWKYTINALGVARGSLGAVNRLQTPWVAPNLPNRTFSALSYNNTEIVFPAPFIEGSVSFSITLSPSLGFPLYSNTVTFTIEAPLVTSVTVVSSGMGDYDANPCTDIEKATAAWAVNRNSSSVTRNTCLANILSYSSFNVTPAASSASCFRVTPSTTTGTTALKVSGRFFGGGKAVTFISLTSITFTASSGERANSSSGFTLLGNPRYCTIDQALSTWSPIPQGLSSIVCYLQTSESATYATGPMALTLSGYQDTLSPYLPMVGVCPCGYFSSGSSSGGGVGSPCQPCEDNAFCLGGTFPPLALPDYWRTNESEWRDLRSIEVKAAGVAPFVACPTPGQCLADNKCVEGAVGFMCTSCLATDLVTYKRGSAGNCVKCNPFNSRLLVLLVSMGGITILVVALSMPWCCTRTLCCARFVSGAKGCAGKVQCGGCCRGCRKAPPLGGEGKEEEEGSEEEEDEDEEGGSTKTAGASGKRKRKGGKKGSQTMILQREPKPQGLLPLIKIAITFFQTLAAVSLLTTTRNSGRIESPDGLILPKVIQSLTFFLDFGFSLSEFKCAASISYQGQIIMFILLPILCTLGLGPALEGVRVFYERTQRHLHAYLSRTLHQIPDLPKFAPFTYSPGALTTSLLFLLLPSVISILARSQDCVSNSVGGYLVNDPAISCEWGWVKDLKVAARAFALIYLTVPLCVAAYSARGLPGYELFDFLGKGYHQMSYFAKYWECVTLFRKAVIFGIATKLVGLQDPRSQIIAIVLILSFSIAFHFSNWPFGINGHYNDTLNWLDAYSIFASITVSLSIMVRVQSRLGKDLPISVNQQNFLDFLALAFCGPFVLRWLFLFIDALFFGGWMEVKLEAFLGRMRKSTRTWFMKNCAGCTRKRKPALVSTTASSGALLRTPGSEAVRLGPSGGAAVGGDGSAGSNNNALTTGGDGGNSTLSEIKLSLPGALGDKSGVGDGDKVPPSPSNPSLFHKERGFEAPPWLRKRGTVFKDPDDTSSSSTISTATSKASVSGGPLEVKVPTSKPNLSKVSSDTPLTILVPGSSTSSSVGSASPSARASNAQLRNTFPPLSPRSSSGSGGYGNAGGVGMDEEFSTPNPIHAQQRKAEMWAEGVGVGLGVEKSTASDSFTLSNPMHPPISRSNSSKSSSSSSSSSAFTSVSAGGAKGGGSKPLVSPLSSASTTEGSREAEEGGIGFSFQNPMRRS